MLGQELLCLLNLKLFLNGLSNFFATLEFVWELRHSSDQIERKSLVMMSPYKGLGIRVGPNIIHSLPVEHTVGGVARFRFQPRTKKILFIR